MALSANAHTGIAHHPAGAPESVTATRHLLVVGATRGTGRHVVQQALAAGHTVTALARDPARIDVQHQRLTVARGDVLDPATLAAAMVGCDTVVSSLGATSAFRAPTTLYSQGIRNVIDAMRAAGATRLVAVSAAPLSRDEGDTLPSRWLMKPLLWAFLKEPYSDMARMEETIRASGLDWTLVRPPRLTDRSPTGHYRTAVNRSVRRGYIIARADLAGAILTLLDDPVAIRAAIGIGY